MNLNFKQLTLCTTFLSALIPSPSLAEHFQHFEPLSVQPPTLPPQIPTAPPQMPNLEEIKQQLHDEAASIQQQKNELSEKGKKLAEEDKKYKESLEAILPDLETKLKKAKNAYDTASAEMMKKADALNAYVEKARNGEFGVFSDYGKGSLRYTENALQSTNQDLKNTYNRIATVEQLIQKLSSQLKTAKTDNQKEQINQTIQNYLIEKESLISKAEALETQKTFLLSEKVRIQSILDTTETLHDSAEKAWQKSYKAEQDYKEAQTAVAKTKRQLASGTNLDEKKALAQEQKALSERNEKLKAALTKYQQAYMDSKKAAKQQTLTQAQEQKKIAEQKQQKKQSWPSQDEAQKTSLSDISPDLDAFTPGTASGTADLYQPKTYQEILEQDQAEAFSNLAWADASYKVLKTADITGQVAQTAIGFIPGLGAADTALAATRGFAESIGKSIADGVDPVQAIKAAALNAGYAGAISFVGNGLTGGADKYANRVVVLTEVGFSKLKTKQIAELGAKGITFAVIKTSQVIGSAAVDSAGRKIAAKVDNAVSKAVDTSIKKANENQTGGYAGYGTSMTSRPFAQY